MKDIKNRVVFITGGENGLGRIIAGAFAEEGAKVVIFGIDEDRGKKAAEELSEITEALFIKGNVVSNDDLKNAMKTVKERFGKLDFAVNNAGITGEINPFLETGEDQYDKVLAVNLKGVFLSMQNEIALMEEKGFGRIVNVSSEAGSNGFEGFSAYVASKHGINGLTKSVALEYATKGISVNAVAPGTMLTPLVEAFSREDQDALANIRPSKRLINTENVAAMILFLCSPYASDSVGSVFHMDGGKTT